MRITALIALIVITGCKTTSTRRIDEEFTTGERSGDRGVSSPVPEPHAVPRRRDDPPGMRTRDVGPDFLEFPPREDAVVATVGDESLHKSQIFDYLLDTYPQEVRASVAVMLGNRILATEVAKHHIEVPRAEIDRWLVDHRAALRKRAEADLGPGVSFERWLQLSYGQTIVEYEAAARDRERARRLLARVVRYHGILEDTVELRIISVADRAQAETLRAQLEQGADFGVLAERYSIHASAERGGKMFPLWRPAVNPALSTAAFELPVGAVSGVIAVRDRGDRRRYQIVKVCGRTPGRDVRYADVRDEIERGLEARPLNQEEWYMWQVKTERLAKMTLPGL